ELFQALHLRALHPAVRRLPAVVRLLRHLELLADIRDRSARRQRHIGLAQLLDHLLRSVLLPLRHESLLAPFVAERLSYRVDWFTGERSVSRLPRSRCERVVCRKSGDVGRAGTSWTRRNVRAPCRRPWIHVKSIAFWNTVTAWKPSSCTGLSCHL